MALTGLILIAFLLMHMIGNLKMFLGQTDFNEYAAWLKVEVMVPFLPHGFFIWIFRAVILACVVLHMYSAIRLWARAKRATPNNYEAKRRLAQTYSARTMRWGGLILAGLLLWHLCQFTIAPNLLDPAVTMTAHGALDPYTMVKVAFSQWFFVALYAIWMVAVCMHIRHGFWSACTTLGANTSPKAQMVLNGCAWLVAVLIFFGFMIMPVADLLGGIN